MFYIRAALIAVWFCFASFIGFFVCLFRWGDLNLDRDIAKMISSVGLWIGGIRVQVDGLERLEAAQPCIYVANHQSTLDILIFGLNYPSKTIVIGKRELHFIPFFGLAFMASGNIMINRSSRSNSIAGLNKAVATVKDRGGSVFIFPEGTRNRTDQPMLPFKKGAFHMAISAQVPIVPLVCEPIRDDTTGTVRVKVLDAIPTVGMRPDQVHELSRRVREEMLKALLGLKGDSSVKDVPRLTK